MNKQKNELKCSDGVMAFFLSVVVPYIFVFIFVFICNLIANGKGISITELSNKTSVKIINILISQVVFLGIFLGITYLRKIDTKKYVFRKFKLSFAEIVLLILITVITLFGFNELCNLFLFLLEKIGYSADTSLPFQLTNFGWFMLSVLLLCIIPAICEELLFRGIILTSFRNKSEKFALFMSALCFCLIHASPQQTILQFVMGLILGYTYIKSNSLIAPILIHFTNNFIVILFNYIQTINKVPQTEISFSVGGGFLAVLYAIIACLLVVCLIILLNYYYKKKNKQNSYVFNFEKKYFKNINNECITEDKKNIITLEATKNETTTQALDENSLENKNKKISNYDFRLLIVSIFVCIIIWIVQLL